MVPLSVTDYVIFINGFVIRRYHNGWGFITHLSEKTDKESGGASDITTCSLRLKMQVTAIVWLVEQQIHRAIIVTVPQSKFCKTDRGILSKE